MYLFFRIRRIGAIVLICLIATGGTAFANLLLNPDFENVAGLPLSGGNNITTNATNPFMVPGWEAINPATDPLNLVRVDGPGASINYGNLGPESDADNSGPGIIKHYIDIQNSSSRLYQTFTVPFCPVGSPDPVVVDFGASFSNRGDATFTIPLELIIFQGVNPSGTQVANPVIPRLPGGASQNYIWTLRSGTTTLTRGQTYTFAIGMGDAANADNAFVTISPADVCPTTTGDSGSIAEFIQARNTMILSHEPDRHRRIDKLNTTNSKLEAAPTTAMSIGQNEASFATSLNATAIPGKLHSLDIWSEGYFTGYDDDASKGGKFGIGFVGIDYQVSPASVIGIMLQIDHMDMAFHNPHDEISGTGWMAGPYATIKLYDGLFFDLRGAWGNSHNKVKSDGATIGKFDSQRWLVSGAVMGEIKSGNWEFRPELQAKYIEERQDEFNNNGTTIEAQTVSQGNIRFGPRLAYHHVTHNNLAITSFARADGVYSFAQNGNASVSEGSMAHAVDETLRARIEAGVDILSLNEGFKFTASGHYDGIGQDDYELYGGMLRIAFRLN